jgi:hypothetical protein
MKFCSAGQRSEKEASLETHTLISSHVSSSASSELK